MKNGKRAKVTVFSDYVCPFCYLEEPDLRHVRERFGDDKVEVEWRAYELRPEPIPTLDPDGDYLHSVWNASVYPMSRVLGMTLRLPPVQPRSRKALEAAEFARENNDFDRMRAALFKAFFENGRDLGETEVLLEVGESVGLEREALREALEEGRYTEKVVADEELSRSLGVESVPTMLARDADAPLEKAQRIVGAQPYGDRLEAAVESVLQGGVEE